MGPAHVAEEKGAEGETMKGKATRTSWELGSQRGPTVQSYERAMEREDQGGAGPHHLSTKQGALMGAAADRDLQDLMTQKLETAKSNGGECFRTKRAGWLEKR